MTRNWSLAGLSIGLGLLVVAVVIGYDAAQMRVPPIHAKVGPQVFPIIVSIGLAVCGLALVWQSRSKVSFPDAEGETDWTAIAVIAAGLIVHMNILKPLGFVPAGVMLFMSVAFAFGSRKFARDGMIALIVVLITYVSFTRLLGLQLPPGILKGIF